jgi:tripartite-type tricarboxylate transporter receptor subunit TctC
MNVGPTGEAAPMKMMKALFAAALVAGCALHAATPAQAQSYPNRPIRVVVPFPAGGPTDGLARIASDRLSAVLGVPIVVENKGGAGGGLGGKFVAEAEGDGYTILMSPGGSLTTGPMINPNIGYDPVKALAPVVQLVEMPIIVTVNPELPVHTMAEVVAYAKANPGKLKWGSQGFGTAPHLLIELFKLENHVNVVHVPYRGTAPMLNGILGGEVQIVADPSTTVLPHIQAGKLRAIAIGGEARIPQLPDTPSVVEAGLPYMVSPFWLAVTAPSSTPRAIIDKLNAAFREALAVPETRKRLAALGADVKTGSPEDLGQMLTRERVKWGKVVKAANIKME